MREKILNLLKTGKMLHHELIEKYSNVLPANIIIGGNETFEKELPEKVNVIIDILNTAEKDEKYKRINDIDESIALFQKTELQNSIDKALSNEELIGYSALKNKKLSRKEILNNAISIIESEVQFLNLLLATGKMTSENDINNI